MGHRRSSWRLGALVLGALAMGAVTPLGGCADTSVAPLAGRWPSASPSGGTPTPSPRPGASSPAPVGQPAGRPPAPRPPARTDPSPTEEPVPTRDPACLGPVVYPVDGSGDEAIPRSLCLAVGGVLRIQDVGADAVSANPAESVSQRYEAGVVDCRLLTTGTVKVTIALPDNTTHAITIVVVDP